MARIVPLAEAVAELVADGDEVALEGFSHLVPFAAGHELIRQERRDLALVRMVPDLIADQLIGMGCLRRLAFGWAGNPGVGSLHRFRDAVEQGWPRPLELEEHSHAGMANRYVAGASGLPFAVLRGYAGTGLAEHREHVRFVDCPFTGVRLAAVPAVRPDVAIIHAQRADRAGNVQLWGIAGVQKEAVLSARRSLVTVEQLVDELEGVIGSVVIPSWAITYVAKAPGGSYPSYAQGYSTRDDGFYQAWDAIARDRERFLAWMAEHVLGPSAATAGMRHV
jgi:glutaconate CoA-transferase subunit A